MLEDTKRVEKKVEPIVDLDSFLEETKNETINNEIGYVLKEVECQVQWDLAVFHWYL